MPSGDDLSAKDLINVLKKKHEAKSYKSMVNLLFFGNILIALFRYFIYLFIYFMMNIFQVLYVEACESGSMFEGILPNNLNIYAITAANAVENSWGTYCPEGYPSSPSEFDTCLGDLFSISWMEDRFTIVLI